MQKHNLLESWLTYKLTTCQTVKQAISDLNTDLGTNYQPQVFYKWRRGDRPMPQPVQDYMLTCCLLWALNKALGISMDDNQAIVLVSMLLPPNRREKK